MIFIIFSLIAFLFLPVFVVKTVKQVSWIEAVDLIFAKLDKMNQNYLDRISYDVFIGYNGAIFVDYIIDERFHNLKKYWKLVKFVNVLNFDNYIVYKFKVHDSVNPCLSLRHMVRMAQSVGEEALITHFHENGIYISVDNFVATILQADVLNVIIAKNNAGFENIKQFRAKYR